MPAASRRDQTNITNLGSRKYGNHDCVQQIGLIWGKISTFNYELKITLMNNEQSQVDRMSY